ncbi:MAG: type II CAAX endopeptidase family protein [Mesorhizobium sp.]
MVSDNLPKQELAPGWLEIIVGLVGYVVLLAATAVILTRIPDEQAAFRGIVGLAAGGIACTGAFVVAMALRIRKFGPFGFRAVELKWLVIGAALGVAAFIASFAIEEIYFSFITEPNTQADFQAAAKSGFLAMIPLLIAGAIITPLGEEFLFRGIVANALNRHGFWAGVVGSALIFGAAHGLSVIFLLAFMVGVIAAILFCRTGSVWPGIATHVIYNGLHLLFYSTL